MKKNFKILLVCLCMLFLLHRVSAAYITGDVFLEENGNVRFDVHTDKNPSLSGLSFKENSLTGTTAQLLSLNRGVWTFAISLDEYDDIFLEIHLPKSLASISSVEGVNRIIDIKEKTVTLADSGKLDFSISYLLQPRSALYNFYWLLLIPLFAAAFLIYKKLTGKKERLKHILPIMSDKEQQIIDLLMKAPHRQKELRLKLSLPKASFSRYMVNLEKKNLIVRQGEGKNKLVRLK